MVSAGERSRRSEVEQESDASIAEKVMRCDNKSRSGVRRERVVAYLGSGTKTGCAASVKLPRYNLLFLAGGHVVRVVVPY